MNLSDYRPIIWPIAILIVQFAYWELPNEMAVGHFDSYDLPIYSAFIQLLLPSSLLLIAIVKNKFKKRPL